MQIYVHRQVQHVWVSISCHLSVSEHSGPAFTQTKKPPSHTLRFARKPPPSTWSLPVGCYRNKTGLGAQGPERIQSLNSSHKHRRFRMLMDAVVVDFFNLNTSKRTNRPSRLEMSLIDTPQACAATERAKQWLHLRRICQAMSRSWLKEITGFHGCKHL